MVSAKGVSSEAGLLRDDELAVLPLLGVSHDVIDKGISTGLVEGHLDESALRREEVQGLRAGRVLILDEVSAFFVGGIELFAHNVEAQRLVGA